MPKASSTPQGPSENARRIEDAYKCAHSRGGAASVALCIILVCIMPCHALNEWFRHMLPSRVDQLLRALRKLPAPAGSHLLCQLAHTGRRKEVVDQQERIFIRQQFGIGQIMLQMSAAFAQAVRPFLVSLDGDFVFRRLELLLGFSFLRFGFLLRCKQFFDLFRRH